MKNKKNLLLVVYSFITLLLSVLLFSFNSTIRTIISLVLMSSFVLFSIIFRNNKKSLYFIIAQVFVLISDILLSNLFTVTNNVLVLSLITFNIAQIFYMLAISIKDKVFNILRILVTLSFIVIALIILKESVNVIVILGILYGVNLIINCIQSFAKIKEHKTLGTGFIFYILCDIVVAVGYLYNSSIVNIQGIGIFDFLYRIDCWIFYIIGMYLIILNQGLIKIEGEEYGRN